MADTRLKEIDCDPVCGFMVRSHNENEAIRIAKKHAIEMHNDNPSDAEMKKMVKTL